MLVVSFEVQDAGGDDDARAGARRSVAPTSDSTVQLARALEHHVHSLACESVGDLRRRISLASDIDVVRRRGIEAREAELASGIARRIPDRPFVARVGVV